METKTYGSEGEPKEAKDMTTTLNRLRFRFPEEVAEILADFFRNQLAQFLEPDLLPEGRRIIECCLSGGSLEEYCSLIRAEPVVDDN